MNTILMNYINLVFILGSFYLSVKAIKQYFIIKANSGIVLYWGTSFVLIGIIFAGCFIAPFIASNGIKLMMSNIARVLNLIAFFMQLYAISCTSSWCSKYNTTECEQCNFCEIKQRRLRFVIASIACAVIIVLLMVKFPVKIYHMSEHTIQLALAGSFPLDIFYESINIILLILIAYKLFKYSNYGINLVYSFLLAVISRADKLINVLTSDYSNIFLFQAEWATAVAGMVIIVIEVRKLLNTNIEEGF